MKISENVRENVRYGLFAVGFAIAIVLMLLVIGGFNPFKSGAKEAHAKLIAGIEKRHTVVKPVSNKIEYNIDTQNIRDQVMSPATKAEMARIDAEKLAAK